MKASSFTAKSYFILPPSSFILSGRRSQVVRQRSAKPLFIGSIPIAASINQIKTMLNFGFIHSLVRLTWNRALLCLLAVFLFCQAGRAQDAIGSGGDELLARYCTSADLSLPTWRTAWRGPSVHRRRCGWA